MIRNRNYAAFILSHGRPDNVKTFKALRKHGYTGKIYIIVDNLDKTKDKYIQNFGAENVIVFDKQKYMKSTDTIDNFEIEGTVLYARNAAFDIAKKLGLDYFVELDDDYSKFYYTIDKNLNFKQTLIKSLDDVFESYFKFLDTSGAFAVAFAQGGDLIGGKESRNFKKQILRKVMNVFFFNTKKTLDFLGTLNDDVNTYIYHGNLGKLFFTVIFTRVLQTQTQQNPGGLTETYLNLGTYVKSFYSVIINPSCVKISSMGDKYKRIHHKILWDFCVPKILSDKYKKP